MERLVQGAGLSGGHLVVLLIGIAIIAAVAWWVARSARNQVLGRASGVALGVAGTLSMAGVLALAVASV